MCISNEPALITNCVNIPHDPEEGEVINYDDKSIPYFGKNYLYKIL